MSCLSVSDNTEIVLNVNLQGRIPIQYNRINESGVHTLNIPILKECVG